MTNTKTTTTTLQKTKLCVFGQNYELYLWVVNRRKWHDDFLGCRGNWIPITVIINVFLLFFLCQPGGGILCHVAEVSFLQRLNHFRWKSELVCHLLQPPRWSDKWDFQLYSTSLTYSSKNTQQFKNKNEMHLKNTDPICNLVKQKGRHEAL